MNNNRALSLRGLWHDYAGNQIINDLSLEVNHGEILCLLGASGSGKSSVLRIIAGLEPLQRGEIWLDGHLFAKPGSEPPAENRNIGLVFQDNVLFPHMTVAENIGFGLPHLTANARKQIIEDRLMSVGLQGFAKRYPHTLSGGQQQRVALIRALAREPAVMLLDEPFANVDATLRRKLREEARHSLKACGSPTIIVTHDAEEALEMGDKLAIIVDGRIIQQGSPEEIWQAPASSFVAELFGDTQAIEGRIKNKDIHTAFGSFKAPEPFVAANGAVNIVTRPNCIELRKAASDVRVKDIRFLGDQLLILVESHGQTLRVSTAVTSTLCINDSVTVHFDLNGVLVYTR